MYLLMIMDTDLTKSLVFNKLLQINTKRLFIGKKYFYSSLKKSIHNFSIFAMMSSTYNKFIDLSQITISIID